MALSEKTAPRILLTSEERSRVITLCEVRANSARIKTWPVKRSDYESNLLARLYEEERRLEGEIENMKWSTAFWDKVKKEVSVE